MSALVVGAVAPDLPVYLPVGASYATTHSWPGLPVVVFFGMVLLWLWFAVVRDALVDLTPVLRHRVPARARLDRAPGCWLRSPSRSVRRLTSCGTRSPTTTGSWFTT